MAEFEDVLGPANQNGYSSSGSSDDLFPDSVLQMQQNLDNGRAAFSLTLMNEDGGRPDSVIIESIEINSFKNSGCQGDIVCQNFTRDPLVIFEDPEKLTGGGWNMSPKAHDNGTVSGLIVRCGCDTNDVKSYQIAIHVELKYNKNPKQPVNMTFKFCFECKVIEV